MPWSVLAAIGSIETDHGRSRAPGVRSGVNRHGCCAGPMQFNTRDGPPSTWQRYGVDGNHDGTTDVYDPEDAIAVGRPLPARAAARRRRQPQPGDPRLQPLPRLRQRRARARPRVRAEPDALAGPAGDSLALTGCAAGPDGPVGPANLRAAQRVAAPRAYRALPAWALAGGGPGAIDARLYDNAVWILRRYHLRVTAAREAGHHTHGDGTALDLIPADGTPRRSGTPPPDALAHDLGWTPACARSGTRPACHLAPAIQFIGYDGYPGHGSPRTCTGGCPAHLHLSWASPLGDRPARRLEHGGLRADRPLAGERPLVQGEAAGARVATAFAARVAHVGLRQPQGFPVGGLGEPSGVDPTVSSSTPTAAGLPARSPGTPPRRSDGTARPLRSTRYIAGQSWLSNDRQIAKSLSMTTG